MIIYCTKYALTSGIEKLEVEDCGNGAVRTINNYGSVSLYLHGEGRDWHRTRDEANAKAEGMRKKKISSLKKSLVKIEAITFAI